MAELAFCKNDDNCYYSDEYCNIFHKCVIDLTLYINDPCGRNEGVDPCAGVICAVNSYCWEGQCFPNDPACSSSSDSVSQGVSGAEAGKSNNNGTNSG